MRPIKSIGLALMAVFALGAFVATAAQAAITSGPEWVTANGVLPKNTVSTSLTVFRLKTKNTTIECEGETDTGTIKAGNPGQDTTNVLFFGCKLAGTNICHATGVGDTIIGHITVNGLITLLGYPNNTALGSGNTAYDQFFPATTSNVFAEFTLTGSPAGACGVLENKTIKVKATGTEVKDPAINRKCGIISEVGKDDGGSPPVFLQTISGELATLGALNFPGNITTELIWQPTAKTFKAITCSLESAGEAAEEVGFTMVETNPAEAFGWKIN